MSDTQSTVSPEELAVPAGLSVSSPSDLMGLLKRLSLGRYAGVIIALIAVVLVLSFTQEAFMTWSNMKNIIGANSVIFVLALGATFVVITAGIDLSVASLMTASCMVFGMTLFSGWGIVGSLASVLAFGTLAGLANGVLITRARISFLVVTLGALSIWQSFALVVKNGETVSIFGIGSFSPIKDFVDNAVGPIPILLIFDIVMLLVFGGVLRYTSFGRALFAIGSNEEAARLNGINVKAVLTGVYAIAGLTAGLAAIVSVGRLTAGSPTVEPTLLLTVLAAVLIGGTSFTGGIGGVFGTAIGVIFLGVIQNGLTLSNVSSFWQGIVSGSILIIAVGLGVLREHGWSLRQRRAARAAAAVTEGSVS